LVALGIFSYFLYSENQTLTANNYKLEVAVEEQKATMAVMKESYEKQGQSLMQMSARNAEIEEEKNKYLDIFRRHNLNQLAEAKPGLIEIRINKGTADVFKSIEDDSKELSSLNSGNTP
jgi:ribosomal protein L3